MDHTQRHAERPHFIDVAHDEVWVADEQTGLDAEHARALARLGFGFAGGRFLGQTN